MSSFRRLDNLLDGKTSDELAMEAAARERARAERDHGDHGPRRNPRRSPDLRPLVARVGGSVTEGIYGLILGLGGVDVIADTAAVAAATVVAAVELAAAGGYAAVRHRASLGAAVASGASGLTLGIMVVLLKVLVYTH